MRSDDNDPTVDCPLCGGVVGDHLEAIAPTPDPETLARATRADAIRSNLRKIESFDPTWQEALFEHDGNYFRPNYEWLLRYREGLLRRIWI